MSHMLRRRGRQVLALLSRTAIKIGRKLRKMQSIRYNNPTLKKVRQSHANRSL
jgi:hypothetical protein